MSRSFSSGGFYVEEVADATAGASHHFRFACDLVKSLNFDCIG
jgi:hypothetical protein